jgi:hypothetical protein
MLAANLGEGFIGALHDALCADIDPGPRRHLAVHHQALAIEFIEVVPCAPMRHEVRIGDEDSRRILVGGEDADRLSRLHKQCFLIAKAAKARHNAVEGFPVARGAPDAAIDDKLFRPLRHAGIKVVHQHAECRFGEP